MGTKTVTKTHVERRVVDDEYVVEHVEKEVILRVCDICGNDEVGIDSPFRSVSTLNESRHRAERSSEEHLNRLLDGTHVRVTLSSTDRQRRNTILERPLADVQDSAATAAGRLSGNDIGWNVEVEVGPHDALRDLSADDTEDATTPSGNTKLLCPYCHKGLFGEDA